VKQIGSDCASGRPPGGGPADCLRDDFVPRIRYRLLTASLAIAGVAVVAGMIGVLALALPSQRTAVAPTAVLKVNPTKLGVMFRPGAVGLSVEAEELSTGRLSAAHLRLVRLMRLLGPSLLRVGGNSVDFSWWTSRAEPAPSWATSTVTPSDLIALRELLSATGWQALLGVDLGHFEVARAADEAHNAREILGPMLAGIEIGNEPDDFGSVEQQLRPPSYNVDDYLHEVEIYRQALSVTAPGVPVYGAALSGTSWLVQMGPAAEMFAEITQHFYPANDCHPGLPVTAEVPLPTAEGLLSPAVRQRENEFLRTLAQAGRLAGGRATRIGETNGFSCRGAPSASPAFASALWALDWALRAASSGVQGLSFHGGLGVCGAYAQSPICASDERADREADVNARAQYYGLLAARQLEGGRFVAATLSGAGSLANLTAWATVAPNGRLTIAIDDLATSGPSQPVSILARGYRVGFDEALAGPSPYARTGITLGRGPVTDGALWHPRYSRLLPARYSFRVLLHPASAVIVTLYRRS
jgi:hypothetical protein